ncbi:hypothetical protein ACQE3E_06660 [Methylomonas sp. MED-D]|uniref:hypothetical protein n=1 Tax=Methylomonas sp. MED-D TaxID=3418768 RepID=UPI003D0556B0
MSLAERIRDSRRSIVEVGGHRFKIERPTPHDMQRIRAALRALSETERPLVWVDEFLGFVVDWPGMLELDLLPGGTGVEVAFDAEAFRVWVADHPDTAQGLAEAVMAAWSAYVETLEADEKKSPTGSPPDN